MKKVILLLVVTLTIVSFNNVYASGFGLGNTGNNQIPTVGNDVQNLIDRHNAYYIGDTESNDLYLTFDTGYELGHTTKILDVLQEESVSAAFFVTGQFLNENEDLVLRMYNEGHIVANHTYNHPDITKISFDELKEEIEKVENRYEEITGAKMQKFIRPPMGMISETSLKNTDDLNYITVFWSLAFVDWHIDKQQGWKYSYDNIMDRVHNGSIILLHTVSKDNADALSDVLKDLDEDYNFKSLNDLIIPI